MADADGPYVGPRPFDRSERERFFGRDQEARALASLVVAHRVVLLYAASGAGKTSLLNAGAIPLLEDEDGFEVLPTARLQGLAKPDEHGNPYLRNLLANLARDAGDEREHPSLAAFLAARPHATRDDLPAPRLLVIDQFEELFTLYTEHWPQRGDVFDALSEALEQDPLLRIVLSIREDFIAQLDPYASRLRLRTRMRLEPLRRPAALAAIAQPLAGEARTFAPGVAERLVDDLLKVRVHTFHDESVEVPGELVEPVQLQVVCRTLWSSLPPDVREIGEADLARIGSVSDVLSTYYSEAVHAAASAGGIAEHDLRERLEAAFITAVGTRGTVVGAGEQIAGMPAASINELEARHLVRAEWRAGARWFELTHDSLIRPIVSSNAAIREQRRRRREKRLTGAVAGLVAVAGVLVAFLVFGRDDQPEGQAAKGPTIGVVEAKAPLASLRLARELRASSAPVAIKTTAGGRGLLAAGNDGRVRAWDVNLGQEIETFDYGDTGVASVDINRRGEIVAAGTVGVRLWTIGGLGAAEPSVSDERLETGLTADRDSPATAAAFGPGGELLVVREGRASFVSFADSAQPLFTRNLLSVVYSPSGSAAIGIAVDGTVRVRDILPDDLSPTGRERTLQAPGNIVSAAFSASGGQIVTASDDGTARVWHTHDGEVRAEIATGRAPLTDAELSPDGQIVATAGRDGMLRLFSRTGDRIAVIRAGLSPLTAVTWSRDGQMLITAGEDAAVRLWTNHAAVPPLTNLACTSSYDLGRKSYVTALCDVRAGDPVRAPEAGAIANDCGPAASMRVAIKTATGRCWVFLGVEPHERTGAVDAGAPLGEVAPKTTRLGVELWENSNRGRRISNLWDPALFLDVKPPKVPPYPGDTASREEIAQWMGAGAEAAGLPAALPVIAALTESGLRNLQYGDADSIGYFQMRTSLWNRDKYAGFPNAPDRQLMWFVDIAKAVREAMRQRGQDPTGHPELYGEWAADVTRPPEQYRGRFQAKLAEAQQLLDATAGATARTLPLPAQPAEAGAVAAAPSPAAPAATEDP